MYLGIYEDVGAHDNTRHQGELFQIIYFIAVWLILLQKLEWQY